MSKLGKTPEGPAPEAKQFFNKQEVTDDGYEKVSEQLSLLEKFNAIDKSASHKVHQFVSRFVEAGLFFFAIIFNPLPICVLIVLFGNIGLSWERKI